MTITPDKPAPVSFNLDTWRDEIDAAPFVFVHGGRRYEMAHTESLDGFRVLEAELQPAKFFPLALGDAQYAALKGSGVTTGQLKALIRRYLEHVGIRESVDGSGNA